MSLAWSTGIHHSPCLGGEASVNRVEKPLLGLWITQKLLLIEKDVALKSKCTITGKDQRNKAGLFDFFTFCASFRCQEPPFPHSVSLQSLYYLQGLEEIASQRTPPKLLLFFSRKIPPH